MRKYAQMDAHCAIKRTTTMGKFRDVNTTLMRLSRLLISVTGTVTVRGSQDTYGLTALGTPLPRLCPIEQMATMFGGAFAERLMIDVAIADNHEAHMGFVERVNP